MRRVLAAVALSFAATAATPHDEIASLLNEFLTRVDDIAMHERFWAEDLVYVSAAGVVRSKAEVDQSYDTSMKAAREMAAAGVDIIMLGGVPINLSRGAFVKRDGRWQVVSWQATREEPPSSH